MKRPGWPAVLARPLRRLVDRLFRDEDANAIAHGWEIQRLPHGGRRYRDPRWDTVRDTIEARVVTSSQDRTEVPR